MARKATNSMVRVGRLAPPAFLPKPAPIDAPICEPGQLLRASSLQEETMAVSTLLSWSNIIHRKPELHALPLAVWLDNTFVFEKGVTFPKAVLGSRMGPEQNADVAALVVFEDLSSVALWAPWDGSANTVGLFQPLPVAFRKLPTFHAFLDPKAILKVVQGRLVHICDGKRRDLEDAKAPVQTQAIHMGLTQSVQAWMRARPQGLRPVFDAPNGADWGEDAQGVWYVPPSVPHMAFDEERLAALHTHLTHAACLLTHHHKDHVSRWHGEVRARARTADGGLAHAQIEVKALNIGATDYATKHVKLLEAALLRALRLPSCPIPYEELRATGLYWPMQKKAPRRDRIVLTPKILWRGEHTDPPNAHKRLAAISALGGTDWI